jgi:hypothetical protein
MKLNGAQPQPTGLVGRLDNGKVSENSWKGQAPSLYCFEYRAGHSAGATGAIG